jgi:predicted alpha/beta hydrolase family esterase
MEQIVIIHGGDTFEANDAYLDALKNRTINLDWYKSEKPSWKKWLRERLANKFEVILPEMPNALNAKYAEWKLWFEKILPLLNEEIILIGHSLGGSFLIKYLSENKCAKNIRAVFLVAASAAEESGINGLHSFSLPQKIDLQSKNIFLYHSKDDDVVPYSDFEKLSLQLPSAITRTLDGRKHFSGLGQFPELERDIISL